MPVFLSLGYIFSVGAGQLRERMLLKAAAARRDGWGAEMSSRITDVFFEGARIRLECVPW